MSKDSSDNGAATSACPKKKKFDPRPLELYRRRMRARERRERERDPALACRHLARSIVRLAEVLEVLVEGREGVPR